MEVCWRHRMPECNQCGPTSCGGHMCLANTQHEENIWGAIIWSFRLFSGARGCVFMTITVRGGISSFPGFCYTLLSPPLFLRLFFFMTRVAFCFCFHSFSFFFMSFFTLSLRDTSALMHTSSVYVVVSCLKKILFILYIIICIEPLDLILVLHLQEKTSIHSSLEWRRVW